MKTYDPDDEHDTFEKMPKNKMSVKRGAGNRFFIDNRNRVRATQNEGGFMRIVARDKSPDSLPVLPVFRKVVYDLVRKFNLDGIATSSIKPIETPTLEYGIDYLGEGTDKAAFKSPYLLYRLAHVDKEQEVRFYMFPLKFCDFRIHMQEVLWRLLRNEVSS